MKRNDFQSNWFKRMSDSLVRQGATVKEQNDIKSAYVPSAETATENKVD